MKTKIILLLCFFTLPLFASDVTDPDGNVYDSLTDAGWYWTGFGVGLGIYGFGMILRMAKKTASDF